MTPQQFLARLKQQEPAPAYLFLGPEPYQRDYCRKALIDRVLPDPVDRDNGVTRLDLDEMPLQPVLDDACSLSLFASRRVIVVSNAEAALPRSSRSAAPDGEDAGGSKAPPAALERYLADPVPGTVLVFEAARYDFQGEDKKKLERVQKFYSAIAAQVEFPNMSAHQARPFAENLARKAGLSLGPAELDLLVDALGGSAARIAGEIEKLRIYAAAGRKIGEAEIAELVPEARESTIFALVAALGRGDRGAALDILDTLVRQSEYLPLALSFLSTQFRLALSSKDAGLRSPQQIQAHFARMGVPMWPSRAEQVFQTVSGFSQARLAEALETIFEADRGLRDTRPDDRVIMEQLILRLTA